MLLAAAQQTAKMDDGEEEEDFVRLPLPDVATAPTEQEEEGPTAEALVADDKMPSELQRNGR